MQTTKAKLLREREYIGWLEAELEFLKRNASRKTYFELISGVIWRCVIKVVKKYQENLEFIPEMKETNRREEREIETIKGTIRYFSIKDEIIIDFLNQVSKEEITKVNLDRFEWVTKGN